MKAIKAVGLLDTNPHSSLHEQGPEITWKQLMCNLLGMKKDVLSDTLKNAVKETVENCPDGFLALSQLGLLDEELVDKKGNPLDTLSNYLSKKLAYGEGERDLIVMRHTVGISWPDRKKEKRNIDLVVYGDKNRYNAMAMTVGFPTGIAAKMVLDGEIQEKGMILPFSSSIYRPMLKRLKQEGISAKEERFIQ